VPDLVCGGFWGFWNFPVPRHWLLGNYATAGRRFAARTNGGSKGTPQRPLAARHADRLLSLVRCGNLRAGYHSHIPRSLVLGAAILDFQPSNPADDHCSRTVDQSKCTNQASLGIRMLSPLGSALNVVDFRTLRMLVIEPRPGWKLFERLPCTFLLFPPS
jgi:hypothetical protein